MTVNAVVVTYNRLDLLKLTLEKLQEQTFRIKKIVVVNNASTDGTKEYLDSFENDTCFEILNLEENYGGAGGFYYGIRKAYELECDYLWIMDDDTIVTPSALEKLIDSFDILKKEKIGFLTSNVLFKDGMPCLMNIPSTVYRWNEYIDNKIIEISHTSFVAMFIPASVVKEVGLPIKEYFIWGDDGEYSTRIIKAGYSGFLIGESTVYHYMKDNVGIDIINAPRDRIDRFYYFYRNTMTTVRMRGVSTYCKHFLFNMYLILQIIFSKTECKLKKIFIIVRGTIVGTFRRVKIDYIN